MFDLLRTHPYRTSGIVAAGIAGLAWLAFGYFGVHTLFIDDVVSEAAPVFDAPAPASESVETVPAADPVEVAPDPARRSDRSVADVTVPSTTTPAAPQIVTEYEGTFVDEAHPTSGRALVLGNGTGQRFLRLDDFATDNGPDLNVYLVDSSTGDVSDFVDLGDLAGNIGDQNYEIPAGVDLDRYDRVVIWCVRFGVGFGSASLSAV